MLAVNNCLKRLFFAITFIILLNICIQIFIQNHNLKIDHKFKSRDNI